MSRLRLLGLAGLTVAVVASAVVAMHTSAAPAPAAARLPATSPSPALVTAVMFGDSIIAGANAGDGNPTMASEASRRLGWATIVKGVGSTGYTTGGSLGGKPYPQRVERELVGARVDVIVVQGGTNDLSANPSVLRAAAERVFSRIAATSNAKIVVVGPYYPTTPVDPKAYRVRDVLRAVATARGLPFIDELGWMTAKTRQLYVSRDGFHPNAAGHIYLGQRFAQALSKVLPQYARGE